MAAAALLRSMAGKLARAAPPPPPRPHLAGGLYGGARSVPGGSLPPPTSNQIRQVSGDRLAATAGLKSGAALPSLATKIARAPPQPRHPHILNRGLHSGSTPPPTTDKDKIIEELRRRLWRAQALAGLGGVILFGVACFQYFWLLPGFEKMRDRSVAYDRLERELKDVIRVDEDEPRSAALAQIIQKADHIKQQRNLSEEDVMVVCLDILKEAAAGLDEMQADLEKFGAATARMKSAPKSAPEGRV